MALYQLSYAGITALGTLYVLRIVEKSLYVEDFYSVLQKSTSNLLLTAPGLVL